MAALKSKLSEFIIGGYRH